MLVGSSELGDPESPVLGQGQESQSLSGLADPEEMFWVQGAGWTVLDRQTGQAHPTFSPSSESRHGGGGGSAEGVWNERRVSSFRVAAVPGEVFLGHLEPWTRVHEGGSRGLCPRRSRQGLLLDGGPGSLAPAPGGRPARSAPRIPILSTAAASTQGQNSIAGRPIAERPVPSHPSTSLRHPKCLVGSAVASPVP